MLYVEQGFHHDALYSDYLIASDVSFVNEQDVDLEKGFYCTAKFRYRQKILKFLFKERIMKQSESHLMNQLERLHLVKQLCFIMMRYVLVAQLLMTFIKILVN